MKASFRKSLLPAALAAALGLILSGRATAQTFTTLHGFTAFGANFTNADGASPQAGLILSGGILYGTAVGGGGSGEGTVFALNTNGTGFAALYSFTNGSDGEYPYAGLILSGNTLYGTAEQGGSSGEGTVFALGASGSGFATLHVFAAESSFANSDGARPWAGLVLSGNTLYGTAFHGGAAGDGTAFALNTNGTGFATLHDFSNGGDGSSPYAGLVLSGNTLYGTAVFGSSGYGTVFALNTNGTGFTTLHSFTNGGDGAYPYGGLLLSGNTLYGTATEGGISNNGTLFALNINGTGFTILHSFTNGIDGSSPECGLIISAGNLYGTMGGGGSFGKGLVFSLNANGAGFTNLYSFTGGSDGSGPSAGLVLAGDTLYGTTYAGGSAGNGSVFSLALAPGSGVTSSTTAVSSPLNPSAYGEAGVTFTATVTGSGGTPTGTVQFATNGVNFGGAAALSAGLATSAALPTTLAPGNYTVAAVYSGDQNFTTSSGTLSGGQNVSADNSCACAGTNGVMAAGTFTTLHDFTAPHSSTNSDGTYPQGGLILSGNTLYGTAYGGGGGGGGTVFSLNINGTSFTILHTFTEVTGSMAGVFNSDGIFPLAGLLLSGDTLYGTAQLAGSGGYGTVFSLNTNGMDFTTVYSFTNGGDGSYPEAGLILSGGTLYGTTFEYFVGGASRLGTLFAVNTNGADFTSLHNFTNGGGAYPYDPLILSGGTLYGTAWEGGMSNNGTVFSLNTNGAAFTILHSFAGYPGDGGGPVAGLLLSGGTLYGTTSGGGSSGEGTVFALSTDGTGYRILYTFSLQVYDSATGILTNSDGSEPEGGLILSGNTLYGTASAGGVSGAGTVFALNTNGTGFTTLHSFTAGVVNYVGTNGDGSEPYAGLILSGNTLYGTALWGGSGGEGTVFALTLTNSASGSSCLQVQPPSDIVVAACTNVQVFYAPTVTDPACSNWTVVLTPPSGSSFAPGTVATVECAVTDCCGNSNNASFIVTVACGGSNSPPNIVQNGNFCLGNANFTSGYTYVPYDYANYTLTPQVVAGDYTVGPYVPPSYYDWAQFYTENGGCQMLIANGAQNAAEPVWAQTVAVSTKTTYMISFYLAEISTPTNVANIAVVLGGNEIGAATAPSVIDTWQQFGFTWNSGTNTSVLLAINDLQTSVNENDFALANISMTETQPQLGALLSGANAIVLTWPTNAAGFTLQSTTNLALPASWRAVSPAPVIVNGQFVVTNSISVTEMFYRLSQ